MKKVLLSWSSGKDSAFALHLLRAMADVEVVGLLTTVNEAFDRVAMHAVRRELLLAQAAAAGLPLSEISIPYPCTNEQYEAKMAEAVRSAKASGVTHMAFGDLFLEDIRAYREQKLAGTGLTPIFPLWGRETSSLAAEMIRSGMVAHLTCVDPKKVDRSLAGRRFSQELIQALPNGVDPCGENGEFHTFVSGGPMFTHAVSILPGEVVERDGFVFADFRLAP